MLIPGPGDLGLTPTVLYWNGQAYAADETGVEGPVVVFSFGQMKQTKPERHATLTFSADITLRDIGTGLFNGGRMTISNATCEQAFTLHGRESHQSQYSSTGNVGSKPKPISGVLPRKLTGGTPSMLSGRV